MESGKSPYEQLIWKNITKTKEKVKNNPFMTETVPVQMNTANIPAIGKNPTSSKATQTQPLKVKIFIGKGCKVHVKPSNKVISTILSKLKGSEYDIKANQWTFSIEDYDYVSSELIKNRIIFEKIPTGTLLLAKKEIKNGQYQLTGPIYDLLMNFQREAVNFAINRNGRILLGDDMGLGKTIQALAIANYYRIEYPLLILSPASLCYNWMDSIQRFLNEEAVIVREKSDFGSKISIISYNLAVNHIDVISIQNYGIVICAECHYLKSMTTKRTKTIVPILQKASRLIMISGTPATSRPLELYPILCSLDKKLFPSFQVYGNRYCDGRKIGQYYDYRGCTNAIELSTVIEKAFMIRRTKDSVMNELPMKFRRQVFLDTKASSSHAQTAGRLIGEELDVSIMQEYMEASSIKKDSVVKYLEGLLEKGVKCIVFAHHKQMLDALEEFCTEKSHKYVRVDGTTAAQRRHTLVESYQSDEAVRIAILSLTACCTGLTLTAGKAVVFAELYWNPGTMLQAEDRIHRIGQKDNVDIHYLIGKNTVDDVVWPKLLKKLNVLESLGMSKNEFKLVKGIDAGEPVQGRLDFKKI